MFKYYLDTMETIPDGVGFSHYDFTHICWLVAFVVFAVLVCKKYKAMNEPQKDKFRKIYALCIVANELLELVVLSALGLYTIDYLPLHLCSINVFVILAHSRKPNDTLGQLLFALCFPGAVVALVFPMWWTLPFVNFMHWHSFVNHILLGTYPLMLVYSGEVKPRYKALPKCAGTLCCVLPFIYVFNKVFNTNFMFINWPQENSPLEILGNLMGNPGYIAGFAVLIIIAWGILFLPFEIAAKKKENKSA